MICVGRIPLQPLQPCKADHPDVRHILSLVCLPLCVSVSDPMGEEHHIRWTSRVPPLVVVVSVLIHLEFTLRFSSSPPYYRLETFLPSRQPYFFNHVEKLFFIIYLIGSIPKLIFKKRARKKEKCCLEGKVLHLLLLLRFLSLCVAVFSGTCTVPPPREETHASTRVRPKLSTTTWVYTLVPVRTSSWLSWVAVIGMSASGRLQLQVIKIFLAYIRSKGCIKSHMQFSSQTYCIPKT